MNRRKGVNQRNKAVAQKQKYLHKGRKIVFKVVLATMAGSALIYLWTGREHLFDAVNQRLEKTKILSVREVVVKNSCPQIQETVDAVLDTVIDSKIFRVNEKRISSALKVIPSLQGAQVKRGITGRVVVNLIARQPVALVQRNGKIELVDKSGFIFPVKSSAVYEVPLLTGCRAKSEDRDRIWAQDMKTVLDLIGYVKNRSDLFYRQISQIDLSENQRVVVSFQSSPVKFVLDRNDVTANLRYADKIRAMLTEGFWNPAVVNLSHKNLAFLKTDNN